MSNDIEKVVHSRRIQQKNRHIARQVRIRQAHKFPIPTKDGRVEKPHRYHKTSGVTCGDSHCAMCGNPRKFFKELTMQEKRQMQDVEHVRNRHSNGKITEDE
jgi:hypothetical protein